MDFLLRLSIGFYRGFVACNNAIVLAIRKQTLHPQFRIPKTRAIGSETTAARLFFTSASVPSMMIESQSIRLAAIRPNRETRGYFPASPRPF